MSESWNNCPTEPAIRNAEGCPTEPAITSFTRSQPEPRLSGLLEWTTPTLTEIEYTEDLRRLYQCEIVENPINFGVSIVVSDGAQSLAVH